jgi:hypothetical protein
VRCNFRQGQGDPAWPASPLRSHMTLMKVKANVTGSQITTDENKTQKIRKATRDPDNISGLLGVLEIKGLKNHIYIKMALRWYRQRIFKLYNVYKIAQRLRSCGYSGHREGDTQRGDPVRHLGGEGDRGCTQVRSGPPSGRRGR